MNNQIQVEGFTVPSGEEWIRVTENRRHGWAPRREFVGSGKEALNRLSRQNVIIIGLARVKRMLDSWPSLQTFRPTI